MNEANQDRPCLHCENGPAVTIYGLCEACNLINGLRRVYRLGRGRTPEWEAHLLYLTARAQRELPLFEPGYESPPRPRGKRQRKPRGPRLPRVLRLILPQKEQEE